MPLTIQITQQKLLSTSPARVKRAHIVPASKMRSRWPVRAPVRDPETYQIIGAAMEVHRVLGCGFLEAVYRAALLAELMIRRVPCRAELKASSGLGPVDEAQAINYMKVSGLRKALDLNFGVRSLQHRRLVLGL